MEACVMHAEHAAVAGLLARSLPMLRSKIAVARWKCWNALLLLLLMMTMMDQRSECEKESQRRAKMLSQMLFETPMKMPKARLV